MQYGHFDKYIEFCIGTDYFLFTIHVNSNNRINFDARKNMFYLSNV